MWFIWVCMVYRVMKHVFYQWLWADELLSLLGSLSNFRQKCECICSVFTLKCWQPPSDHCPMKPGARGCSIEIRYSMLYSCSSIATELGLYCTLYMSRTITVGDQVWIARKVMVSMTFLTMTTSIQTYYELLWGNRQTWVRVKGGPTISLTEIIYFASL